MATRLTTRAYAKINLGLRILRKRRDGYHDIETVFHRVNVYDEISFEQSSDLTLVTNTPDVPNDETNLCIRAAQLFRDAFGVREGVRINLKKTIPVGAGLGGGSADAGATLLALSKLWKTDVTPPELREIAIGLGSDVSYFLHDGSACGTGRGEVLEYFNVDLPYWIVVVYPGIHVSTAWAYKESRVPTRAQQVPLRDVLLEHIKEPRMLMSLLQNDFEPLLLKTHHPIAEVKQALYTSGAILALMSGSGSAVFGLYSTQSAARNAARALKVRHRVFVTPPHFRPVSE